MTRPINIDGDTMPEGYIESLIPYHAGSWVISATASRVDWDPAHYLDLTIPEVPRD